ncbi:MAG: DUF1588 domain-containing protein, partial [Pirellulaceae bacterium]|nr:DUF1588 domain-containing protein [Verrucomicrobiales bacterium]
MGSTQNEFLSIRGQIFASIHVKTRPVVRGVWVLENILGDPPPPPPPGIPAISFSA